MINKITFNKTYIVEPLDSTNPKLKIKKYKLTSRDRGYSQGKQFYNYLYIPLFKKGLSIEFKPNLNVIVGSNGCGKSQLLKILDSKLNKKSHIYSLKDIELHYSNNASLGFDFENDLLKNSIQPNPEGDSHQYIMDCVTIMSSREKSHGENNKILFNSLNNHTVKDNIIFLDEPELGLDLKSQYKLSNDIKELAINNQVFMVTHNKIVIESCDIIYDLDKNKWVTPEKLFKTIQK